MDRMKIDSSAMNSVRREWAPRWLPAHHMRGLGLRGARIQPRSIGRCSVYLAINRMSGCFGLPVVEPN